MRLSAVALYLSQQPQPGLYHGICNTRYQPTRHRRHKVWQWSTHACPSSIYRHGASSPLLDGRTSGVTMPSTRPGAAEVMAKSTGTAALPRPLPFDFTPTSYSGTVDTQTDCCLWKLHWTINIKSVLKSSTSCQYKIKCTLNWLYSSLHSLMLCELTKDCKVILAVDVTFRHRANSIMVNGHWWKLFLVHPHKYLFQFCSYSFLTQKHGTEWSIDSNGHLRSLSSRCRKSTFLAIAFDNAAIVL